MQPQLMDIYTLGVNRWRQKLMEMMDVKIFNLKEMKVCSRVSDNIGKYC